MINGRMMVIIFVRAVKRKPAIAGAKKKVKRVENKYEQYDIRFLKNEQRKEEAEHLKSLKESEEKGKVHEDAKLKMLEESEEEGIEISGYIDFAHRLKTEDFRQYFSGQKKLMPKNTDLSYYNWNTGVCLSTDSPNFKVDASSGSKGLLFRNKRDRKVINVDPGVPLSENTTRKVIPLECLKPEYKQIVIFIHYTRRKT